MKRIRGERGASAVEFAIVSSLLFMVLFGAIQFGITFNRTQGLQAGAREGARLGSLSQTSVDEIVQRVKDSVSIVSGSSLSVGCSGSLGVDTGCIAITPSGSGSFQPCNLRSGETVRVTVRYQSLLQIPLWKSQGLTLQGDGEFTCE